MESVSWMRDWGWGQVVVALIPIVFIMWFVRWRERRLGVPKYEELSLEARGWIFLVGLAPRASARVMRALSAPQLQAYMSAGAELAERAGTLRVRVLNEFWNASPDECHSGDGWDERNLLDDTAQFVDQRPQEAVALFLKLWPSQIKTPSAPASENNPASASADAEERAADAEVDASEKPELAEMAGQNHPGCEEMQPSLGVKTDLKEKSSYLEPIAILNEDA